VTCDERRDLPMLYAAGALEPAEREALREHLATGCPVCAGALAEAEATVAQMISVVPPVTPPPTALDRLMARVAASTPTSGERPLQQASAPIRLAEAPSRSRGRRILAPLLAAAAGIAVTSGVFLYVTRDARQFWHATDVATAALASPADPASGIRGQAIWDRDAQRSRLVVENLPKPAAGREYELWFIPKGGAPIRSETFNVDADGRATLVVNVPSGIGPGAVAAITDEPLGGSDAPTGTIQLAGEFN
jgi:anti-sigma-K factor RskA